MVTLADRQYTLEDFYSFIAPLTAMNNGKEHRRCGEANR